jgi:hypothetical protein
MRVVDEFQWMYIKTSTMLHPNKLGYFQLIIMNKKLDIHHLLYINLTTYINMYSNPFFQYNNDNNRKIMFS